MPINKGLNYAFGNFYKHSQRRLKHLVRWVNLTYRYAACVIWRQYSMSLKENFWESPRSGKNVIFSTEYRSEYICLYTDCCWMTAVWLSEAAIYIHHVHPLERFPKVKTCLKDRKTAPGQVRKSCWRQTDPQTGQILQWKWLLCELMCPWDPGLCQI